jgi:hypothetical protein
MIFSRYLTVFGIFVLNSQISTEKQSQLTFSTPTYINSSRVNDSLVEKGPLDSNNKPNNISKITHVLFNQFKIDYVRKSEYRNPNRMRLLNSQNNNFSIYYNSRHLNNNNNSPATFGGSYYMVGVIFMFFIIGLLLYVNLCNEYCLRDIFLYLSKYQVCCCLKIFFVKKKKKKILNDLKIDGNNCLNNNTLIIKNHIERSAQIKSYI